MKFAFISDIHANLPALKAVLADLDRIKPDSIFCLGDVVNFAGWDNEVIKLLRLRYIPCLQGNHDAGIANDLPYFLFSYKDENQYAFGLSSIKMVRESISDENRHFLKSLPFSFSIDFVCANGKFSVRLVHGSPHSNNDYVHADSPDAEINALLEAAGADMLVMGHTHIPYFKSLINYKGNEKMIKYAVNAGSVGKPKHGNNKACYCMLELKINEKDDSSLVVSVNFHYVDYDVYEVIDRIHHLGLSDAYDQFLIKG